MKFSFFNRWGFWKKLVLLTVGLSTLLVGVVSLTLYLKQDALIQGEIEAINQTHKGLIVIGDTHIAPFKNFPYISVKVDSVQVYESKAENASLILEVADIYVGFNLWDLVTANYDVQKLLIEDGVFNIIKHSDGHTNIERALATPKDTASQAEPLDIHLKNIELKNLDIHQLDEANQLDVETYIYWAKSGLKTGNDEIAAHLDTEFELNIIQEQDTSFFKHKHFAVHSDILFDELSGLLTIAPSGIRMENGDFKLQGSIDTKEEMSLDLQVTGTKPNFDMLIAFAPENLIPTLERYENAGEFYFRGNVTGPIANGQMPFIDVEFGADEAFMENVDVGKKVDNLGFKGHFTNGNEQSLQSMEFSMENFTSKLEQGSFIASLSVKNFLEPEVDMELHTDFDLDFFAQFFNLTTIENATGKVQLDMRFHDIIDLKHPEKALNELNQAYYSELSIQNLHLESADLPAHIENLDLHFAMSGEQGLIDTFNLVMGTTDLSLKGTITNLTAIVHQTALPVNAELEISSDLLNLAELTGYSAGDSTGIDEQIEDLRLLLKFESNGRALTRYKYLPEGEFLVEELHAQLKNYPHELHDFRADLLIAEQDLNMLDFSGFIDKSDFHFSGNIHNYGILMKDTLTEDIKRDTPVEAELQMSSKLLDIAQLTGFSKEDSTGIDEQIEDLQLGLTFKSTAQALTEYQYLPEGEFLIEKLHAQLKHYPHELHDFRADILIDDRDLTIVDFSGLVDQSDFHLSGQVHEYGFWMKDTLNGDVKLDLSLRSELLKLEDVFSYQGENYVPEGYRHEEFENLALHLNADMHYKASQLHSIDAALDQFDAKMHLHPMRFEDFSGRFHYEDEHLVIEKMHGKLGRSVFDIDMNYYLGKDESIKLRDNHFGLKANYIDFDQLSAFNTTAPSQPKASATPGGSTEDVVAHSTAFNIYELPFTDMTFDIDVDHFIYHHIDLEDIHSRLRTTHDHYIYVDTMSMQAAGGKVLMSGYFNGSNPDRIYLKPKLKVIQADVDQLLFKYENFGQDEFISDHVHGKLTADITGNIRVYPDLIPDLDQSEVHMDVELLDGRLEDYEPVLMLSDYMGDKDLSSVRFDTLRNHMDITNGTITIPNMTIESTLGHYELSGEQSMLGKLDYYIRIPWKIIKQGARYKLFSSKKTEDGEVGDDDIIEKDTDKRTRYLNLRVQGTLDDYDIKLSKKKNTG